ncbi:Bug1p KNAG_0A05690 [Huiozyma naganishii CBS 8797]|uniref:Binder of USO1 and GRH1 protein 1 n=1 Tax=Huiozyma naganishii (strain ATCC MYA-139 / BCRC 22969 / CBS 8797 / KCTC 17520 / NBRC 10181 / NCYC 3082 / Yp74L-3) TaxID=1071383 RepID=J7RF96_HUIN7|nr:hypothetical protein KNAG_0A05690 [Kazachstania naganishii CBS 8797]CCK68233.1 hypothetical protein KNAG_0A05690 [Kazachstania naganishii CBS 8797]
MSESKLDLEEKRNKQLEEARKRVEELKKKKKTKGKKGKKLKKDGEGAGADTSDGTPAAGDIPDGEGVPGDLSDEPRAIEEDAGEGSTKVDELSVDVPSTEDLTQVPEDEPSLDGAEVTGKDSVESKKEEPSVDAAETANDNSVEVKEEPSGDAVETANEESVEVKKEESFSQGAAQDDIFGSHTEGESDFLETIKKEGEQNQAEQLTQQVTELTELNRKLKFTNIEQESTIDELTEEIGALKLRIQQLQNSLTETQTRLTAAEERPASPTLQKTGPRGASVEFASFQTGSPAPDKSLSAGYFDSSRSQTQRIEEPVVDRVLLDKWKNWNVDMTTWRSIGSGPIVSL